MFSWEPDLLVQEICSGFHYGLCHCELKWEDMAIHGVSVAVCLRSGFFFPSVFFVILFSFGCFLEIWVKFILKKNHAIFTCQGGKSPVVSIVLAILLVSYVDKILNTRIMSLRLVNKGASLKMSLLPLKEMKRSQCPFPSYSARIVWDSWRHLAHSGCISS